MVRAWSEAMLVTSADLVRSSRDGDQFHYYWAARQCLKLLRSDSGLVGVSIEGSSPLDAVAAGEYVVDIAEYYGTLEPKTAEKIVYRQLKHSTEHADEAWTVSGLKRTLEGFGEKFADLNRTVPGLTDRVEFDFVSNRPVDAAVMQALNAIGQGIAPADARIAGYIHRYLKLSADLERQFCRQFKIDARAPALLRLTDLFGQGVAALLPGAANDGPLRLKEAVSARATSLEPNRLITRDTVLVALGASPDQLLPAPSLLQLPESIIPIPQAADIALILSASETPVVVHAAGGVGKSVLASQLSMFLPDGSVCLVYDCFALGGYRRSSSPRHEHRQGYVQLANQLAGEGLCDPLVPGGSPSPSDYSRAFMARVRAAAESLEASKPGALLVLAIDAADNAVIAAREQDTGRSFVADLLREELPVNVRVAEFCRTERVLTLEPPPGVVKVELAGFGLQQTRQHLESRFGPVQAGDAQEFHRRTGGNPRVQAQVMRETETLKECLTRLSQVSGNDVTTVDDLLARLVDEVVYHSAPGDAAGIEAMCQALASLRPRIPVDVLVALCAISSSLVRSFAADLRGSLVVDGDTLQFRDEPTETWFRLRFRPQGDALRAMIRRLRPLAAGSAYVATSLPYLLWESGDFEELVGLALTDDALPAANDLERQQIAHQRVQFALKAALRQRAWLAAARLALRAGAHSSGHSRRLRLLRRHSDLAGVFLDDQTIEDLVATRDLLGDWPNSNLVHEGALLSFASSQQDYARSRLRSAIDWTVAWVSAPRGKREKHHVDADDIADIAFGMLNVDGAAACVGFLQRWRPPYVALKPAAIIASRLARRGRTDDIKALLNQEDASEYLLLGVASAAAQAGLTLDSLALERCVAALRERTEPVDLTPTFTGWRDDPDTTFAVSWIVALGVRYQLLDRHEGSRILTLYLPKTLDASAGSRWNAASGRSVIHGLALLSRLRGDPFDVTVFAPKEVTEAGQRGDGGSRTAREFKANVEPFAAWADLWARVMLGEEVDLDAEFQQLATKTPRRVWDYEAPYMFINAVARTASLLLAAGSSDSSRAQFAQWVRSNHDHLYRGALTEIVQHAAGSPEMHDLALEIAELVADKIAASHDSADERIEDLIGLSRALYRLSPDESREYFQQAIEAAELVGDDIHARWSALVRISGAASRAGKPDRARAYRLSQVTEGLDPYLNDSLDYEAVIHAIARLDPCEGIAIASRWRDRRVVRWLDPVIRALAIRDDRALASEPLACIAMTMFQQHPDSLETAERAALSRPAESQLIVDALAALPRFMINARSALDSLRTAARRSGTTIDTSRLQRREARRHPGYEESTGGQSWEDDAGSEARAAAKAAAKAAALTRLQQLDLTSPAGIATARALCRDTPLDWREVTDAALAYPPAKLAQVIRALTATTGLSEFDYRGVISGLASRAAIPRSVRAAVSEMAAALSTRFCLSLTTESYDPLDIDALKAAGSPGSDPMELALEELGRRPDTLGGEACFALAGRLSDRLSAEDAAQVFDDASDQYLDVAPGDTGDGLIDHLAPPPAPVGTSLAGFIWAALGDASVATRWRAAHAVSVLVSLRQSAVLAALARYASGGLSAEPFVDRRLHFYDKHALVWLLMALERSATTADPAGLKPFVPLLLATAAADLDHVLIRESSRNVLLALHSAGLAALDASTRRALEATNKPTELRRRDRSQASRGPDADGKHRRFFFDFSDYWCRPLAEVFNLAESEVLRLAGEVVEKEWGIPSSRKAGDDERWNRRLYAEDSTWAHGSEWPKEDDLDRYLGFHALMTVAGRLIRQQPVYSDEWDEDEDQFSEWLQHHRPSRPDGRWLADRRDTTPQPVLALPPSASRGRDEDWELSLSASSFDTCLSSDDEWLTVWEDSAERLYDRSQDIEIRSALVDPAHSRALAAALQTAQSYHDFWLPTSDNDDHVINESGYRLAGWISLPHRRSGLDAYDPFAARIAFPPPQPSRQVIDLLGLRADADMREWRRSNALDMRSTLWDDEDGSARTRHGPEGSRLEVRREALGDLLRLTGSHLILTVMIDRTLNRRWHQQDRDNDERFAYQEKSYKVYVFGSEGTRISLQFGHRTGQSAGEGTRPD
jgi:hypothetical protein